MQKKSMTFVIYEKIFVFYNVKAGSSPSILTDIDKVNAMNSTVLVH